MHIVKKPVATHVEEGTRRCPNCGVVEARWTVGNVAHVNLSPLDGNCIDCLIAFTKEQGPWPKDPPRVRRVTVP